MSSITVVDQIAVYFGGPYQTAFKYYSSSPITGMGAVRRALPKNADRSQWFLNQAAGTASGAVMRVRATHGAETRVADGGATSGYKKVAHFIELLVQVRSTERDAEDVEDFTRGLLEAIRGLIHADRTCGSGGIEAGKFQVGEDDEGPGSDLIEWELSEVETSAEESKQTLTITFSASEYIEA
jgi:hypothetical protein